MEQKTLHNIQKVLLPKKIYKYRTYNKNSIENLKNNTVWCTTLDQYNDPYEGYMTIDFFDSFKRYIKKQVEKTDIPHERLLLLDSIDNINELITFASEDLRKTENVIKKALDDKEKALRDIISKYRDDFRKSYKICSFSENVDNILMWSHYAHYHEGFCIEYPTESIKDSIFKVIYSDNIFDITDKIKNKKLQKIIPIYTAIIKNSSWEYENEWRLVFKHTKRKPIKGEFDIRPSAIYLGSLIKKRNKARLIKIAKEKGIHAYEMKMDDTCYKLIPQKIF